MVTYPIHVRGDSYRGNDPRKRAKAASVNETANLLETYINEKLRTQKEPIHEYSYFEISRATRMDIETVRDLCFSIDCGHNGFTALRSGLSLDDAMAEAERSARREDGGGTAA